MAVRFLDCMGSHYMTGLQQGRLSKQAILSTWEIFSDSPHLDMIRKAKLAPKSLYLLHCQQKAETFLKKAVKDSLPEQHERIKGFALGADIPEKTAYLLQAVEMELMPKPNMFALGSGIVVGIMPGASLTGEPVLIKNFDYTLPVQDMLLVRRNKPLAGCQTLDVSMAYTTGAHAGLNEHGLAIMHNFAYATDSLSIKSIPINLILQEALETCYTAEEAVRLIKRHTRDSGATILLSDASGDMRVMETSRTKWSQRPPDGNYIIAANHFLTPEMAKYQIPLDSRWGSKSLPRLRGESIYNSSLSRYKRVEQWLNHGPINPDTIGRLLADHSDTGPRDDSICRHGPVFSTMASVIIYPSRKMIRVASGKPCDSRFQEFSMKNF